MSHPGQGLSFPSSLGTKDRLETQTAEGHNSKSRDQERASRLTLWATIPLRPKRDPRRGNPVLAKGQLPPVLAERAWRSPVCHHR